MLYKKSIFFEELFITIILDITPEDIRRDVVEWLEDKVNSFI